MEIFFSALILVAIVLVFTNEFFQQKLGVSPMSTMPKVRHTLVAQIPPETVGTIVELGSGSGGVARAVAKVFPLCQVVGVEYSPFPFMISRLRGLLPPRLPNLLFIRRNFFDVSLKDTSVVVCYLSNPLMRRLEEKFKSELPAHATVISSTFFMPGWEPRKIVDLDGWWKTRIFVYRKEKSDV